MSTRAKRSVEEMVAELDELNRRTATLVAENARLMEEAVRLQAERARLLVTWLRPGSAAELPALR